MRLLWNPTQLTCNLTIGDFPPCTGIQKITGFSRGWHHWNSIRLGYNRSDGAKFVRLWAYAYFKGERLTSYIGQFYVGEKLDVKLIFDNKTIAAMVKFHDQSVFNYNGNFYRPHKFTLPIGYQLFPYAEIDGTEKRKPFEVDIKDVVVL